MRFARWDSGWYWGIARNGYQYVEGGRSNLAFFPVYPMLMRHVGRLFGRTSARHLFSASIVVVVDRVRCWRWWFSTSYRQARSASGRRAERAVLLATVFPFAYFFGDCLHRESVSAGAGLHGVLRVSHALLDPWRARGSGRRTATRVNGILMLPALAWIAWRTAADRRAIGGARWSPRRAGVAGIGVVLGCSTTRSAATRSSGTTASRGGATTPAAIRCAGLCAIWHALLTRPIHVPLDRADGAVRHAQRADRRRPRSSPCRSCGSGFGRGYAAIDRARAAAAAVVGPVRGLGRYCSVLFPLPILLGSLERRNSRHLGLITGFVMFYALGLVLFANVHPLF